MFNGNPPWEITKKGGQEYFVGLGLPESIVSAILDLASKTSIDVDSVISGDPTPEFNFWPYHHVLNCLISEPVLSRDGIDQLLGTLTDMRKITDEEWEIIRTTQKQLLVSGNNNLVSSRSRWRITSLLLATVLGYPIFKNSPNTKNSDRPTPHIITVNSVGSIDFHDGTGAQISRSEFVESGDNDGSIVGSQTMTLFGANFLPSIPEGSTFTPGVHFIVSNVPAGLTPVLTKISPTTATLRLTGSALAHTNANDVSNLTIELLPPVFNK